MNPLPANKEGLGLTSIINVLGSDYRSIYSVDRKTQQVSMYLESKNADDMTRMRIQFIHLQSSLMLKKMCYHRISISLSLQ